MTLQFALSGKYGEIVVPLVLFALLGIGYWIFCRDRPDNEKRPPGSEPLV